ncbi:hypothetical protein [Azospirillum endophyticum]
MSLHFEQLILLCRPARRAFISRHYTNQEMAARILAIRCRAWTSRPSISMRRSSVGLMKQCWLYRALSLARGSTASAIISRFPWFQMLDLVGVAMGMSPSNVTTLRRDAASMSMLCD